MSLRSIIICWVFFLFSFCSCKNSPSNQTILFENLDEGMTNSRKVITHSTEMNYEELENKAQDFSTKLKAEVWLPKALQVKELTDRIITYLEKSNASLRNSVQDKNADQAVVQKLFGKGGSASGLFDSLENYRLEVSRIDPLIELEFKQELALIELPKESDNNDRHELAQDLFQQTSPSEALLLLDQIQNNVKRAEYNLVLFCNEQVQSVGWHYTYYLPIISQSSSQVKAGEKIELMAGIGNFSRAAQAIITINGKKIDVREDGTAHYVFPASTNSGKHIIPVRIEYTDQDGKKQFLEKNVEYTVMDTTLKRE
ncbi:MAG: hypothetical protein ACJ75B_02610 [Flavisolibacter sp.]